MRRTLALVLAVPAALLLVSQAPGAPMTDLPLATSGATPITTTTGATDPITTPDGPDADGPDADGPDGAPLDRTDGAAPSGPTDGPASDGVAEDPTGRDDSAAPPVETTFVVAPVPDAGGTGGSGPVWRYTVEVEPAVDVDPAMLAAEVRAALHDPRSWARDRTMQQVAEPARARIRVVLATPDTVDELCGRVGLRTAGIYSCWNGRFAVLNAWRWEYGAAGFPDLTTYRTYLVNHEVGHGLGFGHVGCPGEGALAPVMMQQSKGLGPCTANGWPHP